MSCDVDQWLPSRLSTSALKVAPCRRVVSFARSSAVGPFIIDVPEAHTRIGQWLDAQGAVSPRGYMRMTLGTAKGLDDPSHVFALAGPELG